MVDSSFRRRMLPKVTMRSPISLWDGLLAVNGRRAIIVITKLVASGLTIEPDMLYVHNCTSSTYVPYVRCASVSNPGRQNLESLSRASFAHNNFC